MRTCPVPSGDANRDNMSAIATQTGGMVFEATTTSHQSIFAQIRGYQ